MEARRLWDIRSDEVAEGRRWRLVDPDELDERPDLPLEAARIEPADGFGEDDRVVYSGLVVEVDETVRPFLLVRRVGDLDYGGDYLELVDGRWRQLGAVPDPTYRPGREYVADPLDADPSFDAGDQDLRAAHRGEFARWRDRLVLEPVKPADGQDPPQPSPPPAEEAQTRVFRSGRTIWWLNLGACLFFAGFTALAFALDLEWWIKAAFLLCLAVFPFAFAELAMRRIELRPDRLVAVHGFRRRDLAREEIEKVHWGKGEGVRLRLRDGSTYVLPDVGSGSYQGMTNRVRAWLRRTA